MKDRWDGVRKLNKMIDYLVHRDGFPNEDKYDATQWAIVILYDAMEQIREENKK